MMNDYIPHPIDTSDVVLSDELLQLTELLAKNVHDTWAVGRMAEGWVYGPERVTAQKTTPCLVEYEQLPDSERIYDRNTAMETIKVMLKLGYKISRV